MTWPITAISAARRMLRSVFAARGFSANLPTSAASGPARLASPPPRPVGDLQTIRLRLMLESKRARARQQMRLAAAIEADLRDVTHQILSRGV